MKRGEGKEKGRNLACSYFASARRRTTRPAQTTSRFRLLVLRSFRNEVAVGDNHPAAAEALETGGIQSILGILACGDVGLVLLVSSGDDGATSEASNRDNHKITCTTSGAWHAHHGPWVSWFPWRGCRSREACGRMRGTGPSAHRRWCIRRCHGRWRCARHPLGP